MSQIEAKSKALAKSRAEVVHADLAERRSDLCCPSPRAAASRSHAHPKAHSQTIDRIGEKIARPNTIRKFRLSSAATGDLELKRLHLTLHPPCVTPQRLMKPHLPVLHCFFVCLSSSIFAADSLVHISECGARFLSAFFRFFFIVKLNPLTLNSQTRSLFLFLSTMRALSATLTNI